MSGISQVVVGTDGSEASHVAVQWAAAEAKAHGAELVIIHTWTLPVMTDPIGMVPLQFPVDDFVKQADAVRDHAVKLATEVGAAKVTGRVERGMAAEHLIKASKTADEVVVGTRGHGGFVGLLLGSVAQQVATHAECPVVIVPHKK
jgi:nucleotide-binding universal stress UspA family protein